MAASPGVYGWSLLLLSVALLSACGRHEVRPQDPVQDSAPLGPVNISNISEPIPKWEPFSKYGNPETYEVFGKTYRVKKSARNYKTKGIASWYGTKFHGRRTSSGEPYDMYKFTAAHKTLPLPTYARVTNLDNNRSIIVKINDRGPFHDQRIIDLSYVAAIKLGIDKKGTGRVEVATIPTSNKTTIAKKGINGHKVFNIYLQMGAFSEVDNAHRMRGKLGRAGFKQVQIWPPNRKQAADYYRVMLGPLESREKTDKISSTLDELGFTQTRVIMD